MPMTTVNCPLCQHAQVSVFAGVRGRDYYRCHRCDLVFVPAEQHITPAAARQRYLQHRNAPSDAGYRRFLDRLACALVPRLKPGSHGLDYGSGPGPTLSVMIAEQGFAMSIYDPFFADDPATLQCAYDFITCTETVEHFTQPSTEFSRLDGLLQPGGLLGIMTQMRNPDQGVAGAATEGRMDPAFSEWWYLRDETHVGFYTAGTMRWIAQRFGWQVDFPAPTITIFQKPN